MGDHGRPKILTDMKGSFHSANYQFFQSNLNAGFHIIQYCKFTKVHLHHHHQV